MHASFTILGISKIKLSAFNGCWIKQFTGNPLLLNSFFNFWISSESFFIPHSKYWDSFAGINSLIFLNEFMPFIPKRIAESKSKCSNHSVPVGRFLSIKILPYNESNNAKPFSSLGASVLICATIWKQANPRRASSETLSTISIALLIPNFRSRWLPCSARWTNNSDKTS